MLDSYVASSTTSYVFISGLTYSSFYRFTITSGAVTAAQSYADLVNTGLIAVATFVTDQSSLSVLFYSNSFKG